MSWLYLSIWGDHTHFPVGGWGWEDVIDYGLLMIDYLDEIATLRLRSGQACFAPGNDKGEILHFAALRSE
jgi:hypothetical protein